MRQFWTVVPNAGYGTGGLTENTPTLPAQVSARSWVMPGDLSVAEPTAGEGNHNHLIIGSMAAPSSEAADDHIHWIVSKPSGGVRQITVGGTPHTHGGELQKDGNQEYVRPKYFIMLITCDESEFANLQANGVDVYAERERTEIVNPEGGSTWQFGALSNTVWGSAKMTAIQNRLHNALGVVLPDGIDTDREFIPWILGIGGWRPTHEERG